ncbi:MAG: hypothetical protein OER88_04345 [Planctomycetota bacterium]|nr:hypothetical protein [Planctomycetota bacterium]
MTRHGRWLAVAAALCVCVASVRAHPAYGVVADTRGNVYVLNWPFRHVARIRADGKTDATVKIPAGDGVFPHGIAIDREGRVHVAATYSDGWWSIARDGSTRKETTPELARALRRGVLQNFATRAGTWWLVVRHEKKKEDGRDDTHWRVVRWVPGEAPVEVFAARRNGPRALNLYAGAIVATPDGAANLTADHRVWRVAQGKAPCVIAGSEPGFRDGRGTSARFKDPYGICADGKGGLFVADEGNHRVRHVTAAGTVTTVLGTGKPGATDGPAKEATLDSPYGVCRSGTRLIVAEYVSTKQGSRIRLRVLHDGKVSTLARLETR